MYIEGITLEHLSALPQTEINSSKKACPLYALFHYFLSDDSKQDATTTTAHSKHFIELLKQLLTSTLSKIWENTVGCEEKYICASVLYHMSHLFQCHSIIIDQGISAPGHAKEVVDGINTIDRRYMYQLLSNVQLPLSRTFDPQILMYSCTPINDVSLAK